MTRRLVLDRNRRCCGAALFATFAERKATMLTCYPTDLRMSPPENVFRDSRKVLLMLPQRLLPKIRRRVFLRMGGLSALGLTLPDLLKSRQLAADTPAPKAKACILLYMTGGPAQQETFDMKPSASEPARGEFRPVSTTVPGTQICELLPRLAQNAHHYAILRSMHHDQTFHGGG